MIIDRNSVVLKQAKNAKSLNRETLTIIAIERNSKTILDFNRQQMRSGKNSSNDFFSPPYSVPYLKQKRKLSSYQAPDGIADLFLTGEMSDEMLLQIEGNQYDIGSTAPHTKFVTNRYVGVFGLNPMFLEPARTIVTIDQNKLTHQFLNK